MAHVEVMVDSAAHTMFVKESVFLSGVSRELCVEHAKEMDDTAAVPVMCARV